MASGLLLPEEYARERIVVARDDFRALDRATKVATRLGMRLFLACAHSACFTTAPIERLRRADGGITLRCPHADRVVMDLR